VQKLHNKDFQIAFKTGSDANKSKFAKECVHGELYLSDDALYVAESSAGVNDSALSKFLPAFGDATIFSTEAALISSIAPAGTSAYANDTGRVYISNGSGWAYYNRDLINQYSLDFDGSNDYMEVSSTNDFAFGSTGFSISFWFKGGSANDSSGFGVNIFDMRSTGNGSQPSLWVETKGTNSLVKYYSAGSYKVSTTATLNSGTWYHLVITNDGSNTKIYLDGNTTPIGTGSDATNYVAAPLKVGSYFGNNYYFKGKIDEFSIFSSELSSADVSSVYNNGTPDFLSSYNPVGWWRMGDSDGGTGTTITDQGSGGNDATLVNGPTFSTDTP